MTRRTRFSTGLICVLWSILSVLSSSAAEPITVDREKLEPLTFSRLVVMPASRYDLTLAADKFRILMLNELRSHGYKVVGGESLVFGRDESAAAHFVLGGTLTFVDCADGGTIRACAAGVTWEVLDKKLDRVIYQRTSSVNNSFARSAKEPQVAANLLISLLEDLLSRPKFVGLLQLEVDLPPESETDLLSVKACEKNPLELPADMDRALEGVILVRTERGNGSGVMISPDGFALTAHHVVGKAASVTVGFKNGLELPAIVVRSNPERDLSLLRVPGAEHRCLGLTTTEPEIGHPLYAIGAPLGEELSFSVSSGIISGMREWSDKRYLQTDAAINPGNSGGPLLSVSGEVIGIVSWKFSSAKVEGLGFGIPGQKVGEWLDLTWGEQSAETAVEAGASAEVEGPFVDEDVLEAATPAEPDGSDQSTASAGPAPLSPAEIAAAAKVQAKPVGVGRLVFGVGVALTAISGIGMVRSAADLSQPENKNTLVTFVTGGLLGGGGLMAVGGLMAGGEKAASAKPNVALGFTGRGLLLAGRF